jgi:hypothetical protein
LLSLPAFSTHCEEAPLQQRSRIESCRGVIEVNNRWRNFDVASVMVMDRAGASANHSMSIVSLSFVFLLRQSGKLNALMTSSVMQQNKSEQTPSPFNDNSDATPDHCNSHRLFKFPSKIDDVTDDLHLLAWCHLIAASVGHRFIAERSKNATIGNVMVEGARDDL